MKNFILEHFGIIFMLEGVVYLLLAIILARSRWKLRWLFFCIALIASIGSFDKGFNYRANNLWVQNLSNDTFASAKVTVCDSVLNIEQLESGQEVLFSYTPCSEGDYKFLVNFESGKKIEEAIGYIDGIAKWKDIVSINEKYKLSLTRELK